MNWNLFAATLTANPLGAFMLLLVNALAVYRIARVVARDTITDRPRTALTTKFHGMLVNLILCIWCLSFWLAIGAVLLTVWSTSREGWLVIASMLSVATIAGQLSERA